MIIAEGLSKKFGPITAIEDVSFTAKPKEIVGFLGPNGAGKTTTMRILAGVFPPTEGRAMVAGYDIVAQSLEARRHIGYFPERISLYLDMTVESYLRYVAEMKEVPKKDRHRQISRAAESCGVEEVARRLLGTLSKGYRQRVGIAQALLGEPSVLILDEPTSGLDPEQVAEVRSLIRSLGRARTIILSTHILSEVEVTCDRVMIINKGRLLTVDTPQNLNQRLRTVSQIHLEVEAPVADLMARLGEIRGVLSVHKEGSARDAVTCVTVVTQKELDLRREVSAAITSRGWALLEIRPKGLTLEEIFLALVAEKPSPSGDGGDV